MSRALASVKEQIYQDFEVLVIDDDSSEDVSGVVERQNDRRFRLLSLEGGRGAGAARNFGTTAAKGAWVAFLDSDDEWLPNYLLEQMNVVSETKDRSVAWTLCYRISQGQKRILPDSQLLAQGEVFCELLRNRHRAVTCSAFIARKTALQAVGGFDEQLSSAQDIDLWLALADAGYLFAAVNKPLVFYRGHSGRQISNDLAGLRKGAETLHEKWRLAATNRCGESAFRAWCEKRLARIEATA